MADKFVVKPNIIKTNRNSLRRKNFLTQHPGKLYLAVALLNRFLRRDASYHQRIRTRQCIIIQRHQQIIRITNRFEIHVRPLPSKLHNAVLPRIQPAGFQVVEEKCLCHTYSIAKLRDDTQTYCSTSVNGIDSQICTKLSPVAPWRISSCAIP